MAKQNASSSDDRFARSHQATLRLVQLSYVLIAISTLTVIVSAILER